MLDVGGMITSAVGGPLAFILGLVIGLAVGCFVGKWLGSYG